MRVSPRTGSTSLHWMAVLVLLFLVVPGTIPDSTASAQIGGGGLIVDGLACPEANPADNVSLADCQTPAQAPAATVSDSAGGYQASSQDDVAGRRIWTGLQVETVNIAVTMPVGAVAATVGCGPESASPDTYAYGSASVAPPETFYSVLLSLDYGVRCIFYYHFLTQTAEPTATTAPPDQAPTEPANDNGTVDYVGMTVYACPEGLPADSTVEIVLMECTQPAQGIPYYLETGPEIPGNTGISGTVEWERPEGLEGEIEIGYNDEYVAIRYLECAEYPTGGQPEAYVPWNGGTPEQADEILYPSEPGVSFHCVSYLQPTGARLELMTWTCSDAFDPEGDLQAYRTDPEVCTFGHPAMIELSWETEDGREDVLTVPSYSTIVDWHPGPLQLELLAPDYTRYVHCEIGPWHQYPDGIWGDKPAHTSVLRHDLAIGDSLNCEWFVVSQTGEPLPTSSASAVADGTAVEVQPGFESTGEIRIYKFVCPAETTGDYQSLVESCELPGPNFAFQRERGGVIEDAGRTDSSGRVWFANVPIGTSLVREAGPQANEGLTVRVFCGSYESGGGGLNGLTEFSAQDGFAVELDIQEDWITLCEWYNIPLEAFRVVTEDATTQYGQVIIHKFRCDLSTVVNRTYHEVSQVCEEPRTGGGFSFVLSYDGIATGSTTDLGGRIDWDLVPPGPVSVTEATNGTGYRIAAVFCTTYPVDGAAGTPEAIDLAQLQSNSLVTELPANSILECYWYNELDPEARAGVDVIKYLCPPGYDIGQFPDTEARENCRREYGVPIRLTTTSGYDQTAYTGIEGHAGWQDVPFEQVTLMEPESDQYELGWAGCSVYYFQNGPREIESAPIENGSISFSLRPGFGAQCELFNIWTGPPEDYDVGYGQVHIAKYFCPESWTTSPGPDDAIQTDCNELSFDAQFVLVRADQSEAPLTFISTETVGPVLYGVVSIQEPAPYGDYTYRVQCVEYTADVVSTPYADIPVTIANGVASIEWTIRAGTTLSCYWFNLPYPEASPTAPYDPAYARVLVHKYMCGDHVDPAVPFDDLRSACSNSASAAGFEFGLTSGGTTSIQTTTPNDNPTWTNLSPGPITITESLGGSGYRAIAVRCAYYPEGANPVGYEQVAVQESADGATIAYDLQAGYTLECHWFNHPDVTGFDPIVVKFMCPYGYTGPWGSPDLGTGECRREYGRTIYLDGPNGALPMTMTSPDGFAYATDQPIGDYRIYEEDDPDSDLALAFCSVQPIDSTQDILESRPITDGGISINVPPGYRVYCEFYNVWTGDPAGYDQGYGQLLIHKYDCPLEGNIYPGPDDAITEVCTLERYDVPFRAFRPDDSIEPVDFPSGYVSPVVTSGPLVLAEIVPDGYRVHRVFCVELPNQGNMGPMSEMTVQDVEGGSYIELTLRAGYVYICNWYNRPYLPEETPVYDPTYYPSPGDGFAPGEEYTPTYTVEAPYEYTATPTYPPDYTPTETYPADYTVTVTYEPEQTYTPEYTATYDPAAPTATPPDGGQIVVTATYTATIPNVTDPGASETPSPEPTAVLSIISYECPAGYDPTSGEADPAEDCTVAPGESTYRVIQESDVIDTQDVDEDNGKYIARFIGLDEGIHTVIAVPIIINGQVTLPEAAFIGSCTSSVRAYGDYAFLPYAWVTPDGTVTLKLLEGEELTCSWYRIPRDEGSAQINVYTCPGAVANPARCSPAQEDLEIALIPEAENAEAVAVTSVDGAAEIDVVSGRYLIEIDSEPACLVDSIAIDDEGYVVIVGGEQVDLVAYQCAA